MYATVPDNGLRPPDDGRLSRGEAALTGACGLALTLAQGLNHLESNQLQYFLHGLRLADPCFIPADWATWHNTHFHFAFTGLVWLMQAAGPLWLTTQLVHALTMVAMTAAVLLLAKRLCARPVPVLLAVTAWLGIGDVLDPGLGGMYVICYYLQPSQVAGPLLALGLALLMNRRYASAGLVLGVAGVFHASFMVSAAPVVLAQVIASGAWKDRRALARLTPPLVLLWGVQAVAIILQARGPADPLAQRLRFHLSAPMHHIVATWSVAHGLVWTAWIAAGAWSLFRLPKTCVFREARLSFLVGVLTVAFGVACAVPALIPAVTTATLWRIAFWPFLLGLLLTMDAWIAAFERPEPLTRGQALLLAATLAAGLAWVGRVIGTQAMLRLAWVAAVPAGVAAGWFLGRFRRGVLSSRQGAVLALSCVLAASSAYGLLRRSNLLRDPRPDLTALAAGLRRCTPARAVLVVPPRHDMAYLRLAARRALVVDAKCVPFTASETLEWYRRLCDVCGARGVMSFEALEEGYRRLDAARARELGRRYGVTHVIVAASEHQGDVAGLAEVCRMGPYRVLAVPSPADT